MPEVAPYYREEHEAAYQQIERLGFTQWNDLFDQGRTWTYEHFQNRAFLEAVISALDLPNASGVRVFEYGCGTGPAACFLAGHGFQVDAIDLVPEAIAIARRMANARNLHVGFSVGDICSLATESPLRRYDMVLDSYVLQSIVTDHDRRMLFAAVRARLKPDGHYVISTALRDPQRVEEPGYLFDTSTGMYYREVASDSMIDQATMIDGRTYVPHRRHLTVQELHDELAQEGFEVLNLATPESGDIVCRLCSPP